MRKILFLLSIVFVLSACEKKPDDPRSINFNDEWLFSLDQTGDASAADLDDSDWRSLDLPHDWSVEFPFDSVNGEGCTAYLPGGIGWYRKHFEIETDEDSKVFILFDGIYNHSECWINGVKLGEHPYGYSPFFYDLSQHIRDGDNVLAVKVDRSRYADSRWYPGSGIYRNVKLIRGKKLHIPVWGTFVTTPKVSEEEAEINIEIKLKNEYDAVQGFELITEIVSPDGETVKKIETSIDLAAGKKQKVYQSAVISNPALWGVESPLLYKALTKIVQDEDVIDTYETTFGIRSIKFDPEKGFFLNGENMKIKGVCLHHDGGLVGSAVPKGVWKRRLQILRDGGCNAIRISHNPASDEFLELCDEMGFLVQDEFFDEWDFPKDKRLNQWERHDDYISRGYADVFQEWAETDLKTTILAHHNHPSVIQWSIGNEIEWNYPRNRPATGFFNNMSWQGNYFWSQPPHSPEQIRQTYESLPALEYNIGETAQKLADWTREMDTSRPVIANCILPSASFETGYIDALDIAGFSYRRVMYDYARENYPDKVVMGTENLPQWHEWKAIEERDFVAGLFLWTGIDYMGESNDSWPTRNTRSGLIDQAGFLKPAWHLYKTLWQDDPHIYISSNTSAQSIYHITENGDVIEEDPTAWERKTWFWHPVNEHWNYKDGEEVIVELISNCEKVELFLNNSSLGVKYLKDFPDRIYKWAVPFEAGELKAVGSMNDSKTEEAILTSGAAAKLNVESDIQRLKAGTDEVSHLVIQLADEKGNPVMDQEAVLYVKVEGTARLLGVDNGWHANVQTYQSNRIRTHNGKALIILQAGDEAGNTNIRIESEGLITENLSIDVK